MPEHPGRVRAFHGALEDYLRALQERFAGLDLTGSGSCSDCANGATFRAAPEIFRRLGADVGVLAHEPDGRNINDELRLDAHGAPAGGDADRRRHGRLRVRSATATACWPWTATPPRSSTATS